jgi:DNA uptake protein ComE-like DNA-binding protein
MTPVRLTLGIAALLGFTACASGEKGEDSAAATAAADSAAPTPAPAAPTMVNPNDATAEQLRTVPGLDSATVAMIVAGRPYTTMIAVDNKLAKKTEAERDSIYTRVFVPIDINKATRKEIELIPGVGPKMSHEFEEYRPWTSIEQFRREIGKYVDSTEVARLERYIVIR